MSRFSLIEQYVQGEIVENLSNYYSNIMEKLKLLRIVAKELLSTPTVVRSPEPDLVMSNEESVRAFDVGSTDDSNIAGLHWYTVLQASAVFEGAKTVIDLGCGSGHLLLRMAAIHPDIQFTGVDLSDGMLRIAEAHRKELKLNNVQFCKDDISRLSKFSDGSFDGAVTSLALHHLPDLRHLKQTFETMDRVLTEQRRVFAVDLGRLKNSESIDFVVETLRNPSDVIRADFDASLRAAFSITELAESASEAFGSELTGFRTVPVPLVVLLRSQPHEIPAHKLNKIFEKVNSLGKEAKSDFYDLVRFFRLGGLRIPKGFGH